MLQRERERNRNMEQNIPCQMKLTRIFFYFKNTQTNSLQTLYSFSNSNHKGSWKKQTSLFNVYGVIYVETDFCRIFARKVKYLCHTFSLRICETCYMLNTGETSSWYHGRHVGSVGPTRTAIQSSSMFLLCFSSSLHTELSVSSCVRASVRNLSQQPYYRVVCLCAFVYFTRCKKELTEDSNLALTRIKQILLNRFKVC